MGAGGAEGDSRCGDFGGEKADGEPCGRKAGWGTDHLGEGPCQDHGDAKDKKMERLKEAFLAMYLEAGGQKPIRTCAKSLGVSNTTIWRWRRDDPEFDRKVMEAVDTLDELRLEMVEESAFARIVRGEASASLTKFYMENTARRVARRRGESPRWSDSRHLQVDVDADVRVEEIPYERRVAALRAIAGGASGSPDDAAPDAG